MTIVRPVTNEEDLQNLDTLPDEKLRTEFIEQIIALRRKILNKCKIKTFKGKEINGEQYVEIIKSYLEMINSDIVPNIESIWVSLCKSENFKILEKAKKEYEVYIKQRIQSNNKKFLDEDEFRNLHQEAKKNCIILYTDKSIGEENVKNLFLKEMKIYLKERFKYFQLLNEEEMKNSVFKFLKLKFEAMEIKLKCNEIKSLQDIENHLSIIENDLKINFNFKDSSTSNQLFLDFKSRLILFSSNFFIKTLQSQNDSLQEEKSQMQDKFKWEISEHKEKHEKETKRRETSIDSVRIENFGIKNELNTLKERYELDMTEKDQKINFFNESLQNLKIEFSKEKENLIQKLLTTEEAKKDAERKSLQIQADFEKEKALLDFKVDHLNKIVEEMSKKEKSAGHDLKFHLKEQQNALKETSVNYEKNLKTLSQEIEKLKEKILDLESNLSNKENQIEIEKIQFEDNLLKLRNERDLLTEKLNYFKKKSEEEKLKSQQDIESKEKEYKLIIQELKNQEEEFLKRIRSIEEENSKKLDRLEREVLISNQSREFMEVKCHELNEQIQEQKNNFEKIIEALQSKLTSSSNYSQEFSIKIEEIKSFYEQEKKQLDLTHKREKEMSQKEIEKLKEILNIKNLSHSQNEKIISEMKNEISLLIKQNENLINEKISLEGKINSMEKDYFKKWKEMNDETEKRLDDKERIFQEEIKNLNRNSEEALSQFKSLFEIEKMRLEEKLKDEKIRSENRNKNLCKEYEDKINSMEKEHKEEVEELQRDYNEVENEYQSYMYNADNEINILSQRIKDLENQLKENKESSVNIQNQLTQNLDSKTEAYENEKKELLKKLEELKTDFNNKEKDYLSLNFKKESLEKTLYENEQSYNSHRRELEEDIKELISKHDSFKNKQQEIVDELLIKKLEFTRETALLKQQIEFLNTKLDEQVRVNEENQREYEESIISIKNDLTKDFSEKLEIVQKEKEDLLEKLNKKKKELRDLEQTFLKQTCLIEKEKNVLNDKIGVLGGKNKELIENYQNEIEKLSKEMVIMKNEYFKEIESYRLGNEELRKKLREEQIASDEKEKKFEDERSLLEGKIKLIEKQMDEYKLELVETQPKVEKIIDAIQKRSAYDKHQMEYFYQEKLNEIEKKYQMHLNELQEAHQTIYSDMVSQNQDLEKELKNLSLQAELRHKTYADPNVINKKISDLIEVQDRLRKELEENKKDKDRKLNDYQSLVEREKEIFKYKITDAENKCREVETKRALMIVEYEKERAKWSLEKDHLISSISELQETIDRLQKKIESLIRENEKIRGDKEKDKESFHKRFTSSIITNNNINANVIMPGNYLSEKELNIEKFDKYTDKFDKYDKFDKPRLYNPLQMPKTNVSSLNTSKILNEFQGINMGMTSEEKFESLFNNKNSSASASKILSSISKINKK
jgi:hypothetical protein